MSGADINFYFTRNPYAKLFLGPRLLYGKDMLLAQSTYLTAQFQIGWMFNGEKSKLPQHLSIGFGILSFRYQGIVSNNSLMGWGSINYRFNVRL
jgi:hypothetical protein